MYNSWHLFVFLLAAYIPTWTAMYQSAYNYAIQVPASTDLPSCLSACLADVTCYGISWNAGGLQCYVATYQTNDFHYTANYDAYVLNRTTTYTGTV